MSFDLSKIDLSGLKTSVADALVVGIEDLVDGAKEDIRTFGIAIASDLLVAKLEGRDDMVDQLLDQLKVLAEIHRIRVEAKTWATIKKVVMAVLSAVLAGLMAA